MGKIISTEVVNTFLSGHDPMEHIITIECDYQEDQVSIIYVNDKGQKRVKLDDFKPFIWCKNSAAIRLYDGNRQTIIKKMKEYGIRCKKLITEDEGGNASDRLDTGYKYMFYTTSRMSYQKFLSFFKEGGVPVHETKKKGQEAQSQSNKEYMAVTPVEQYMIETGKRLFKGYENYNELNRLTFDLETQGLNPRVHRIEQIGIHTNRKLHIHTFRTKTRYNSRT